MKKSDDSIKLVSKTNRASSINTFIYEAPRAFLKQFFMLLAIFIIGFVITFLISKN